ncbi:hypothetical protein [Vibrio cholerae]|uniref:hypothetical protein n=1 Tax=Vibrio cholerae TaxID=666 RepID=UPI0008931038|nr:hypothetical protein [Vibrio cholerae]OFI66803.1 hypothetical protein BFX16_19070 [Vibrio cholerae]
MSEQDNSQQKGLNGEDVVIIFISGLTLVLSVITGGLWSIESPIIVPPPIIAILLGISVASLVYRFLGGVGEATFKMTGIKVTGSAAILFAVAYWANMELKPFVPDLSKENTPLDLSQHVIPKQELWYAVEADTGNPIPLEFPLFGQSHVPPSNEELSQQYMLRSLNLENSSNDLINVVSKNGKSLTLGHVSKKDLNGLGFFNDNTLTFIPYRVAKFSASQLVDINANLPFVIETTEFSENFTRYQLLDRHDRSALIYEGAIELRNAEIVEVNDRFYLISVIEVNHQTLMGAYAKIYVAEIIVKNV